MRTYGQHMYFSYKQDLTRSMQDRAQQQQQQQRPLPSVGVDGSLVGDASVRWRTMDHRFVFNGGLLKPLIGEASATGSPSLLQGDALMLVYLCGAYVSKALPGRPPASHRLVPVLCCCSLGI